MLQDNFSSKTINLLNLNESLKKWFKTNEKMIVINELTSHNTLYLTNLEYSNDTKVLKQMVNVCLNWLEGDYPLNDIERIIKATKALNKIYELEKSNLSKKAKSQFKLPLEENKSKKVLTKHDSAKK